MRKLPPRQKLQSKLQLRKLKPTKISKMEEKQMVEKVANQPHFESIK